MMKIFTWRMLAHVLKEKEVIQFGKYRMSCLVLEAWDTQKG